MNRDEIVKLPLYAKVTLLILGMIAIVFVLIIARSIIVPFVFSLIISVLLQPIVNFLVRIRIPRIISIIIALILGLSVIAALSILIFSQLSRFSESWPVLVDKSSEMLNQLIGWLSGKLDLNPKQIQSKLEDAREQVTNLDGNFIGKTLLSVSSFLVALFLIPVYIFLLLFYKPLLLEFIFRLTGSGSKKQVTEIIQETRTIIQQYLVGLLIETSIIATLQISTLLILGIDYALLLGIIGALLNLIPYIGGLVGVALPMIVSLIGDNPPVYALYILIIYYIIQLIDNNFIVPKIVASKVKINALFSILIVIVGNAIWGVPGMFLSIPILAILKLIFDRIEHLKPWGFLLGDSMPEEKLITSKKDQKKK